MIIDLGPLKIYWLLPSTISTTYSRASRSIFIKCCVDFSGCSALMYCTIFSSSDLCPTRD